MQKTLRILFFIFVVSATMQGQKADITAGCSPLTVNFFADSLNAYYWDFEENNASSTLQNPQHIFTHPGVYRVKLYEGKGNRKVGEITITVYKDPQIYFYADSTYGCVPFTVNFFSNVNVDTALTIVAYNWAFGDGESSHEKNPVHIYNKAGLFTVSLEIVTDLQECITVFTRQQYIEAYNLKVDFESDKNQICDYSGTITFINTTPQLEGNKYFWDFGNGKTSTEYSESVHYDTSGVYTVVLTVTTKEGCVYSKSKTVTIGKPLIKLKIPERGCISKYWNSTFIENHTIADSFVWSSPDLNKPVDYIFYTHGIINGDTIDNYHASFHFHTLGLKTIYFKAIYDNGCYSDTTFTVEMERPDSSFTMDPLVSCFEPVEIKFAANDTTLAGYVWNYKYSPTGIGREFAEGSPYARYLYELPYVDSLFINAPLYLFFELIVTTKYGCKSRDTLRFKLQKPNAHFTPSVARGCAPLKVTFYDRCTSREPVTDRWYYYGDGDSLNIHTDTVHTHVYTEPGEYYVKMIMQNEAGCIDTSDGQWIIVGEPVAPLYEIDKTDICLGDTVRVRFKNTDKRIDSYHVYSDDGRFNYCWKGKSGAHVFETEAGTFPVYVSTEYNGCYVWDTSYTITVKGVKADAGFSLTCDDTHNVLFVDKTTGDNKNIWYFPTGDIVENKDSFRYYFENTGSYIVKMKAVDPTGECPDSYDSVEVFVTDVKAVLDMPFKKCFKDTFYMDGSGSVDLAPSCRQPLLWDTPWFLHPVKTGQDYFSFEKIPRGTHKVTLIAEDINGCRDTVEKYIHNYFLKAGFELDHDAFCVPAEIKVKNTTIHDTTIVDWQWKTGQKEKEPVFVIPENYYYNFYNFELWVTDAYGCKDTAFIQLLRYWPHSNVTLDPGNNICTGDELTFSASDYTEHGSHLAWKWILHGIDTFENKVNTVVLDKKGHYKLDLNYVEVGSGCKGDTSLQINVFEYPVADFYTGVDSLDPVCYPKLIQFINNSDIDGPGYVFWHIGDIPLSDATRDTQVVELPKGTHNIVLIAKSLYGCADSISKQLTLVGPEGEVVTDKNYICPGDSILFRLVNTKDVNEYQWDFGDGYTLSNVNPVVHTYTGALDSTYAKIILKSNDNNCETSIDIPIKIFKVTADFEKLDSSLFCNGKAYIKNLSEGANRFIWNVPGGEFFNDTNNIIVQYPNSGEYDITLIAIDTTANCRDTVTKIIDIEKYVNIFIVPNVFTPNGDGENDYFRPVITNEGFDGYIRFNVFKVYNRWGNLVYDNDNPGEGWNGEYQNKPAPAGVYAYYLEADVNGCDIIRQKGNVLLIR